MIEELQKILLSFNGDKLHITFSGKKHLSKSCQHEQFFLSDPDNHSDYCNIKHQQQCSTHLPSLESSHYSQKFI